MTQDEIRKEAEVFRWPDSGFVDESLTYPDEAIAKAEGI